MCMRSLIPKGFSFCWLVEWHGDGVSLQPQFSWLRTAQNLASDLVINEDFRKLRPYFNIQLRVVPIFPPHMLSTSYEVYMSDMVSAFPWLGRRFGLVFGRFSGFEPQDFRYDSGSENWPQRPKKLEMYELDSSENR